MGFSYDKLWKKLIDEKMNKLDLQKAINTTPHTIAKMGRDENVSMEILGRICSILNGLGYIVRLEKKNGSKKY